MYREYLLNTVISSVPRIKRDTCLRRRVHLFVIAMATVPLVPFAFLCLLVSTTANTVSLNSVLFSGDYEFIDLSYPFDNETVYWPGNKDFEFTKKTVDYIGEERHWSAFNEFAAAEHGGTHIDAPYHFFMTGQMVGDIPLEKLIVPLIIVDISSKVNDDPNFVLHKHDLDYLLNDNMGKPCVIVFKFGWGKYYSDIKKYLGSDGEKKTLNFPGLSAEVAEWITTAYKNVVGIGVDVASIDPGSSIDYPVHRIVSKSGLYIMENVNLNQPIPDYGCTALVMPMNIAQGTGAPLRLVAICPKKIPNHF